MRFRESRKTRRQLARARSTASHLEPGGIACLFYYQLLGRRTATATSTRKRTQSESAVRLRRSIKRIINFLLCRRPWLVSLEPGSHTTPDTALFCIFSCAHPYTLPQ